MKKLKKNDLVVVLAGKDKGKTGEITRILDDTRLYVSGINMIKRHTRRGGNPAGSLSVKLRYNGLT